MLRRLFPIVLILFVLLLLVPSALAQDLPADIIPTAVDAANAAIPGLGQPNEWSTGAIRLAGWLSGKDRSGA